MKTEIIARLHRSFERFVHTEDGVEFWYARDLQGLLGYSKWENFLSVIRKGRDACLNGGVEPGEHFVNVRRTISADGISDRDSVDIKLTRYACYLVAQNGHSKKEEIAFAQTYFAIQARRAEVIEARMKELRRLEKRAYLAKRERRLAGIAFERGVDSAGFARVKSKGDQILFGGNSTQQMKENLGIPERRPLADFLPAVTLTAKAFADEITEHNLLEKDLRGEGAISAEHEASNHAVRRALLERNVVPEKLPAAEDIRKVRTRLKIESKRLREEAKPGE